MNRAMLKQYTKLAEFLGLTLGPSFEITLHDIQDRECSIAAIVNGSISGRNLDSPPTVMAMKAVAENAADQDYRINYTGLTGGNKSLRSSTYYIKDKDDKLVGMLCINFDDSEFQSLSNRLFQLIHPDKYVENHIAIRSDILSIPEEEEFDTEHFEGSVTAVAESVIKEIVHDNGVPVDRLTHSEKIRIVAKLKQKGVFRLKGAVTYVSDALRSSPASIYRYLSKVEHQEETR